MKIALALLFLYSSAMASGSWGTAGSVTKTYGGGGNVPDRKTAYDSCASSGWSAAARVVLLRVGNSARSAYIATTINTGTGELVDSSASLMNGDPTSGYTDSMYGGGGSDAFTFTGAVKWYGLREVYRPSGACTYASSFGGSGVLQDTIAQCAFMSKKDAGYYSYCFYINDAQGKFFIYDNYLEGLNYGVRTVNINAASIFENNLIDSMAYGIYASSQTFTAINNVCMRSAGNDFATCTNVTGYNNTSMDGTGLDGNFKTGSSGNTANMIPVNEFVSQSTYNRYYGKLLATGSLYNSGRAPLISKNTKGIRGNNRPYDGTHYSRGADEYLLPVMYVTRTMPSTGYTFGGTIIKIISDSASFNGTPACSLISGAARSSITITSATNSVLFGKTTAHVAGACSLKVVNGDASDQAIVAAAFSYVAPVVSYSPINLSAHQWRQCSDTLLKNIGPFDSVTTKSTLPKGLNIAKIGKMMGRIYGVPSVAGTFTDTSYCWYGGARQCTTYLPISISTDTMAVDTSYHYYKSIKLKKSNGTHTQVIAWNKTGHADTTLYNDMVISLANGKPQYFYPMNRSKSTCSLWVHTPDTILQDNALLRIYYGKTGVQLNSWMNPDSVGKGVIPVFSTPVNYSYAPNVNISKRTASLVANDAMMLDPSNGKTYIPYALYYADGMLQMRCRISSDSCNTIDTDFVLLDTTMGFTFWDVEAGAAYTVDNGIRYMNLLSAWTHNGTRHTGLLKIPCDSILAKRTLDTTISTFIRIPLDTGRLALSDPAHTPPFYFRSNLQRLSNGRWCAAAYHVGGSESGHTGTGTIFFIYSDDNRVNWNYDTMAVDASVEISETSIGEIRTNWGYNGGIVAIIRTDVSDTKKTPKFVFSYQYGDSGTWVNYANSPCTTTHSGPTRGYSNFMIRTGDSTCLMTLGSYYFGDVYATYPDTNGNEGTIWEHKEAFSSGDSSGMTLYPSAVTYGKYEAITFLNNGGPTGNGHIIRYSHSDNAIASPSLSSVYCNTPGSITMNKNGTVMGSTLKTLTPKTDSIVGMFNFKAYTTPDNSGGFGLYDRSAAKGVQFYPWSPMIYKINCDTSSNVTLNPSDWYNKWNTANFTWSQNQMRLYRDTVLKATGSVPCTTTTKLGMEMYGSDSAWVFSAIGARSMSLIPSADSEYSEQTRNSSDTVPPTVTAYSPANGATAADTAFAGGKTVVIQFSEAVKAGSGSFTLYKWSNDSSMKVVAVASATINGFTVTVPFTGVHADTSAYYYVKYPTGIVTDSAGNSAAGVTTSTGWRWKTSNYKTQARDWFFFWKRHR
jgi:hypothetical protein